MTRAYSTDLRERVVAAVRLGSTCRVVAERFGVAVSSVMKWSQLEVRTGSVVPGRTGGHRKPIVAPHHDWLMALALYWARWVPRKAEARWSLHGFFRMR